MLASPFGHKQEKEEMKEKWMERPQEEKKEQGRGKHSEDGCRCDGLCLSQSHIKLTAATDGLQALFYTLVSITQLINRRPVTVGSKVSHTHTNTHTALACQRHCNAAFHWVLTFQTLTVVLVLCFLFCSQSSPLCYQGNKAPSLWSHPFKLGSRWWTVLKCWSSPSFLIK